MIEVHLSCAEHDEEIAPTRVLAAGVASGGREGVVENICGGNEEAR